MTAHSPCVILSIMPRYVLLELFILWSCLPAFAGLAPKVVEEVRQEVLRKNVNRDGRPLPVVGHWANGFDRPNFSSDYQIELLEQGHHIVPTLPMPNEGEADYPEKGWPVLKRLATWNAVFSLRAGQWEATLLSRRHPIDQPGKWRDLPAAQSPLVIGPDGKPGKMLSPWGAIEPWREVGHYYTSSKAFARLQELYPNPPRVIFLSNNEAPRLKPKQDLAQVESRYATVVGEGKSRSQRNELMATGYVERYSALLDGMRSGLATPAWKESAFFVAYGAFGPPHLGRWPGWVDYSMDSDKRMSPWHLCWQGGSPSYYMHNWDASTDYKVWSPQIESMNWVFMLQQAYRERPEFWFELSIWDGNSSPPSAGKEPRNKSKRETFETAGQQWTPDRYAGFTQFGMWLTTPRVVREFRGSTTARADYGTYFEAMIAGVDRVWTNPTLQRFWRFGRLIPNRSRPHPYQSDLPPSCKDVDRWFLLNTSIDPQQPWTVDTEIPVFAIARETGEPGTRQCLIYAHSPLGEKKGVEVDVPGFFKATLDTTPGGVFYLLEEKHRICHKVD